MDLSDITRSLCELDLHWRSNSIGKNNDTIETQPTYIRVVRLGRIRVLRLGS